MFDRLATSANTRLARAGKSNQSEMEFNWGWGRHIFSALIRKKRYMGSLFLMFDQTLFACLATERFCATNTILDENIWQSSRGLRAQLSFFIFQTTQQVTNQRHGTSTALICVKMASVMGVTWILGIAANLEALAFLWYPYVVLNSLQGTFHFITRSSLKWIRQVKSKGIIVAQFWCCFPNLRTDSRSRVRVLLKPSFLGSSVSLHLW